MINIRNWWTTFSFRFLYNYGWSKYVFLFDGWIAKSAMAVPVIGYLILFNDTISSHISFDRLAKENTLSLPYTLSANARLNFIYFGLIFLGLSNILYRRYRPYVFRVGTNEFQYVEKALVHYTIADYIRIDDEISTKGHHTQHGKYYTADFELFLDRALGPQIGNSRDVSSADWNTAKSKHEGLLRSILIENFYRNNTRNRFTLTICIVLAFFGYVLLFIPSADLFFKVLRVLFLRHF